VDVTLPTWRLPNVYIAYLTVERRNSLFGHVHGASLDEDTPAHQTLELNLLLGRHSGRTWRRPSGRPPGSNSFQQQTLAS